MSNLPWYKANNSLLQKELDALSAVAVSHMIDPTADSQGILQLNLTIDSSNPNFTLPGIDGSLSLEARFPDNYPYFRPEVYAQELNLPRHHNPIGKNLCLLPRATDHWEVEWTLAAYLQSQLPKVLVKGAIIDPNEIASDKDEQAEPASEYYPAQNNPIIFDSSGFDHVKADSHDVVQIGRIQVGIPERAGLPTRMAVIEATTMDGQLVSQLPETLKKQFSSKFDGILLRLTQRPPFGDAPKDLAWLRELVRKHEGHLTLRRKALPVKGNGKVTSIIGLNIPEEIGPGTMGMGWIFMVVYDYETIASVAGSKKKTKPVTHEDAYYAKVARVSQEDLQIRVPKVAGLKEHKIAIAGLGAIGAPSAIEFAKNQLGELRILDHDIVDPGPTVRWPLGLITTGLSKVEAIQTFLADHYPLTKVKGFNYKIGGIRQYHPYNSDGLPTEPQVINDFLDGVSVLYDATVEPGVNHFLSQEARKRSIPYVSIYATPGAWGGLIMRVIPGETQGCWMCLQYAKGNSIPIPIKDPMGDVQAAGCGDLTFTGTSFDLQNVTLAGVRLAISSLLKGTNGGYPNHDWDVGVLALMDSEGKPIPPTWQRFPLLQHPNCPYCSGE